MPSSLERFMLLFEAPKVSPLTPEARSAGELTNTGGPDPCSGAARGGTGVPQQRRTVACAYLLVAALDALTQV